MCIITNMLDEPRQSWELYEKKRRHEHVSWLRNLTSEQALILYEDMYRLASTQQGGTVGLNRLERRRWEEKTALRRKMRAVTKLVRMRRN